MFDDDSNLRLKLDPPFRREAERPSRWVKFQQLICLVLGMCPADKVGIDSRAEMGHGHIVGDCQ